MHPHIYTLNLLKEILENIPENFPADRKAKMEKQYQAMLADEKISPDKIETAIRESGHEIWPYRKAFEKMFGLYGAEDYQATVFDQLDPALKDKYQQYLNYHTNRLKRIREAAVAATEHHQPESQIPDFLNNEEYLKIEQAEIEARNKITAKINQLITGNKAGEFAGYLKGYQEEQKLFDGKIIELKKLADKYPGLAVEITDAVKNFEEAFSLISSDVNLIEIEKKIEDFKGRAGEGI